MDKQYNNNSLLNRDNNTIISINKYNNSVISLLNDYKGKLIYENISRMCVELFYNKSYLIDYSTGHFSKNFKILKKLLEQLIRCYGFVGKYDQHFLHVLCKFSIEQIVDLEKYYCHIDIFKKYNKLTLVFSFIPEHMRWYHMIKKIKITCNLIDYIEFYEKNILNTTIYIK